MLCVVVYFVGFDVVFFVEGEYFCLFGFVDVVGCGVVDDYYVGDVFLCV